MRSNDEFKKKKKKKLERIVKLANAMENPSEQDKSEHLSS